MPLYPSGEWMDAYAERLDDSEILDDLADGWGVGFDGDILLVMSELPLEETRLRDLPPAALEGLSPDVVEGVGDVSLAEAPERFGDALRPSLPAQARELLHQIESKVVDGSVHAYLELEDGDCKGIEVLESPDERDAAFSVRGSYDTWQEIIDGRPPASAALGGDLSIEGNPLRQLQYLAMFQYLGTVASEVETTYVFESSSFSPATALLDETLRQPAFVHRTAQRHLNRTLNLL
jgi:putative sterol carrier protein